MNKSEGHLRVKADQDYTRLPQTNIFIIIVWLIIVVGGAEEAGPALGRGHAQQPAHAHLDDSAFSLWAPDNCQQVLIVSTSVFCFNHGELVYLVCGAVSISRWIHSRL